MEVIDWEILHLRCRPISKKDGMCEGGSRYSLFPADLQHKGATQGKMP